MSGLGHNNPPGDYSIGSEKLPGLSKLIEECGEVMQVAGKFIGSGGEEEHWDGTNLRFRLEKELADLRAAIDFVIDHNRLDRQGVIDPIYDNKRKMFERWHAKGVEDTRRAKGRSRT